MKFGEDLFPLGTFKGQRAAGATMDNALARDLNIMASKLSDDHTFMVIVTGDDDVGNGKTTLTTQMGCYLTLKINELYNVNNTFTADNMFFRSKDLIESSFKKPKYSVLVQDEGDELTSSGLTTLARRLKTYFRKCRQLNQIIIIILPSYFELPKFYALSRSKFLINVKFYNDRERGVYLQRGLFHLYGHTRKKWLYVKGHRDWNYDAVKPTYNGKFSDGYTFFPNLQDEIAKYKRKKHNDMVDTEEEVEKSPEQIKRAFKVELYNQVYEHFKGKITHNELTKAFDISLRTIQLRNKKNKEESDENDNKDDCQSNLAKDPPPPEEN